MSGDDLKGIQDPLFARVNRPERGGKNKARAKGGDSGNGPSSPSGGGGNHGGGSNATKYVLIAVAVILLGGLGYYIYYSQQQLDLLHQNLSTSQQQLAEVSEDLVQSKETIGTLQEGLSESEKKIQSQRRELGQARSKVDTLEKKADELTNEQQQQQRDLQAINLQKADKSEVEELENQTSEIRKDVGDAQNKIGELREVTGRNRADLENTRADLTRVSQRAEATAGDLSAFKDTFARDIYDFELEKKGAVMKIVDVALDLKNTDFDDQHYKIEIQVDGRRIQRKEVPVNVPIEFYVKGYDKPYELIVTKVGRGFVVGQLSVPKQRDTSAQVSG
ncbi:MAG TPA: hypothetical protein VLU25_19220 [Acidobacteriota bacterium]|nr:hypothetical protein [Acidobacteriota bacterium]